MILLRGGFRCKEDLAQGGSVVTSSNSPHDQRLPRHYLGELAPVVKLDAAVGHGVVLEAHQVQVQHLDSRLARV